MPSHARSDTVRLGLTALLAQQPDLQGCVFLPGDQPCLTRQTLEALADRCRAGHDPAAGRTRRHTGQPCAVRPGIILLPSFTCRRAAAAAPCCAPTRQAIRLLPTPAAELRDIDTRSDLEALRGGKG